MLNFTSSSNSISKTAANSFRDSKKVLYDASVKMESGLTLEQLKHVLLLHFTFNGQIFIRRFHTHTDLIELSRICNLVSSYIDMQALQAGSSTLEDVGTVAYCYGCCLLPPRQSLVFTIGHDWNIIFFFSSSPGTAVGHLGACSSAV